MILMDHSEALRLQAAEKYILGELSPKLREEYEEHYFECEECASDVRAVAVFGDGARELFRKESGPQKRVHIGGWFAWLRPAIAAPALAALLLVVCYQSFVTIPKLRRAEALPAAAQSADFVSLIGANSRAEGTKRFSIHRDRLAILEVDVPTSGEFASYLCQLRDASGRTIYEHHVSAADAKSTVHLILPKGALQAGEHSLAIIGLGSSPATVNSENEIARLIFSVEMLP
jgi:Putative zinc-finger